MTVYEQYKQVKTLYGRKQAILLTLFGLTIGALASVVSTVFTVVVGVATLKVMGIL